MAEQNGIVALRAMKVSGREGIALGGVEVEYGVFDIVVSIRRRRAGKTVVVGVEGVAVLVVASLAEGESTVAVGVGRRGWGLEDDMAVENAHGDRETAGGRVWG